MKKFVIFLLVVFFIGTLSFLGYYFYQNNILKNKMNEYFLASSGKTVKIYDNNFEELEEAIRGTKVEVYDTKEEKGYQKISYKNNDCYVKKEDIVKDKKDVVLEKNIYVRTYLILYKNELDSDILRSIKKGEKLEVTGYSGLNEDGSVSMYKVKYDNQEGYVYAKYTVLTHDESLENYNENNSYAVHKARTNEYGGGSAANLDYYPTNKVKFENNKMPNETRTLYLNAEAINNVDAYIELAKNNNINAFVVDMKDNNVSYKSNVAKEYTKTSYDRAYNSYESYQKNVKKLKDAGFYIIGRITTFKDDNYVKDHKENTILDSKTNKPFLHNSSYWPSAYKREVWEYNVKLAIEGVKEMGFNEIQFDYVRFPDSTYRLEKNKTINFQNEYNEEKAQAIQQFLLYAADELHKNNAYISADVFGEASNNYVTGYGQYWPAISNVVDVISPMPYPDHFNAHDYGISEVVWKVPYKLLRTWGGYASDRQKETTNPAVVRTWIQTYNTIRSPYIVYDATKVKDQINGLYESGLAGGYITWNGSSSLEKYKEVAAAFK